MRFAQIGGTTLHVEVGLMADRPTVVFVNSLGSDLRIWDGVFEALAEARIGACATIFADMACPTSASRRTAWRRISTISRR